jgi:hypothetical protein
MGCLLVSELFSRNCASFLSQNKTNKTEKEEGDQLICFRSFVTGGFIFPFQWS